MARYKCLRMFTGKISGADETADLVPLELYKGIMRIVLFYLVGINLIAFALMAEDKRRARRHCWRIPEKTLFLAALLGGSAGALAGMYLCHHKTKHWYFVVGMPLILTVQLILAFIIEGRYHVV